MWEGLNELINSKRQGHKSDKIISIKKDDKNLADLNETSNIFNNFFTSIAGQIRLKIRQNEVNFNDYLGVDNIFIFELIPCSPDDIIKLIDSLNTSKSIGPNSIPTFILKELKDVFSSPLSFLFNQTFTQGKFPDILKLASVIP